LWSAAFASELWNNVPLATLRRSVVPHPDDEDAALAPEIVAPSRAGGPTIVIGYDERSNSPDIFTGVVQGLERMSCQIIDIGLRTQPCLSFAVHHLSADAGLYVTGAGCDPAWTGFDVHLKYGLPADSGFLERWNTTRQSPISRPSRMASHLRAFPAAVPYETSLWKYFHALRPLEVVCGSPSPLLLARLERLFARLPGRLVPVKLPIRSRKLDDPQDMDVARIGDAVREHSAHLGVVIDDGAAACAFVDERGQPVGHLTLGALAFDHLLRDAPNGLIVLPHALEKRLAPKIASRGGMLQLVNETECAACLLASDGLLAVGSDHRLWFGGDVPVSDAIVTLAVVMQALSRTDAEFSRVVAQMR
jgi:phosphomannomutase